MSIIVVRAQNGESYDDYREWNCFYVSKPESVVKSWVDLVNQELARLANEAHERYQERLAKEPEFWGWHKTAPGERYLKFLRDLHVIRKRDPYAVTQCLYPIQLFCEVLEEGSLEGA